MVVTVVSPQVSARPVLVVPAVSAATATPVRPAPARSVRPRAAVALVAPVVTRWTALPVRAVPAVMPVLAVPAVRVRPAVTPAVPAVLAVLAVLAAAPYHDPWI